MTAERDEFKVPTMWTAVHSPTKSRITTVDHFIYIDQLCGTGMERVFDFFIMVNKNFLNDIHMIIMEEYYKKSNPHPLMNEGAGGVDVPKALCSERNGTVYHVLMYIGDGQAINASSSSTGIIISNVDYGKTCWGVRLIGTETPEGEYEPDRTNYSQSDLELIWAVVAQEDDKSYEGALAVISSAMNRADKNYGGYGKTVLEQLTADGQYCYSPKVSDSSLYQRRLGGNVADYVKQAVSDCLTKGIRNHDYLNFRSSNRTGLYTRIGDNWYF